MKARIHALQVEIKTIENILNSLSGPMQQSVLEELKNMRFELEMLNRMAMRTGKAELVTEETAVYA